MKRRTTFVALLLVLVMLMSACAFPGSNANTATDDPAQNGQPQNAASAEKAFTQNAAWSPVPITKTVKILTVGNEQAVDCAQYLVPMARELGVEIVLGHLFVPGGNLASAFANKDSTSTAFTFYKFSNFFRSNRMRT